ncbi:hypothetical protein [Escherichia phage SRT8]|uniref:Uncharacterized protein n=1 Tax=Escherichia phage SRT8 TaxID=2496545 RepID=A0A2D1GPJ1_9CAUD|nr:DNA repair exonuclease [Escherichia phage SRT8]ATN93853.1 hypothetical protein [Escherichia phage SRT8]
MSTAKITTEQLIEERSNGLTLREIAEKYGMHIRTVEARHAKLAKEGHFHGNAHVSANVPTGFAVKGTSTMIRADGSEVVRWVKTDQDKEKIYELMKAAQIAFCEDLPRATPSDATPNTEESLLALYPVFDLHIGALAHKHESGENYSTDIAEEVLNKYFDYAVTVAPEAKKAVLLIGGDFLHSDGLDAVTPASGHVLDQDSRYAKLVYVAIRATRRAISRMLEKHEEVEVQIIEGNHDQAGMIWLRAAMAAYYDDEPRVYVDVSPMILHKTKWGKTLLGYTHGHTMKKADTRLAAMAADFREEFGDSKYVYTHSGHWHHQTITEHTLGIDEVHGQLGAKDAYAARGGWRAYRQAAVIVYDKKFGEVGRFIYRPEMTE